jgi:iron complex transport system permease protein
MQETAATTELKNQEKDSSLGLILSLVLAVCLVISASLGRVDVGLSDIKELIQWMWQGDDGPPLSASAQVFLWVRLPRCLMAALVGTGLAVSGAVYQALFRNPLVSPNILGVSAGCTFGAALGLSLSINILGLVQGLSFAWGLAAVAMSVLLARAIAVKPIIVLVLAGMVVLSFFNAGLMVIKYFADPYDTLPSIIFWIMGSLTRATWSHVMFIAPITLAGLALFLAMGFRLNILSLGDIQSRSLGVVPAPHRRLLIIVSSLIVAATVSVCGQIAWIGLIIPHMARGLAGPRHEKMLPVTALLGAICLVVADTAARSLSTAEIPVGIITALAGAPVFAFLLYKNRKTGWL